MNNSTYHRYFLVFGCVLACLFIGLLVPATARATTKKVTITTKNYDGGTAIQEALDLQSDSATAYDSLTVLIQPGTYDITESFVVYSNTTIQAQGAVTIRYVKEAATGSAGRAPLISNACSGKKGYTGASNITITGGTWDFQGQIGSVGYKTTMEAFRFMHGQNIQITNVTMQNLYQSHYLTIEGVNQVKVQGCTFKNSIDLTAKKEAIHIDCMHNSSMAPSNQDNTIYDDTICNNVTVTGCTFSKVPRGVGTHIAIAGLFPSNIVITNNTFTDITYEAIKAYHYKNVQITGNNVTRAGCGIRYYLHASDSDDDEEGKLNYQTALSGTQTESLPTNLNVKIQNNVISDITDAKLGYGIYLGGSTSLIIAGVAVSGNTVTTTGTVSTACSGIFMRHVKDVNIYSNTISLTKNAGVRILDGSYVTINANRISSPGGRGFTLKECAYVTLYANTILSAGKEGIYGKAVTDVYIKTNKIKDDSKGGIVLKAYSTGAAIKKNKLVGSKNSAIKISQSKNALIRGNTIRSPGKYGIYTYTSDSCWIAKNTIKESKSTAIMAFNEKDAVVKYNKINQTGNYGILFKTAEKSYAKKNTITLTKNHGIYYWPDCKNAEKNLKYPIARAKKGKSEIHGYATADMTITITIGKMRKTKKVNKFGSFFVQVKKLKKKQKYTVQIKDALGNTLKKEKEVVS